MIWERLAALRLAYQLGFQTSVSCEPLLESTRAQELFEKVKPYVTETVWFGCMNQIERRVVSGTDPAEIERIGAGQRIEVIRANYEALKYEPAVRWKDSYRKALGIEE